MPDQPSSEAILNLVTQVYSSIVVPEKFVEVLELWDDAVSGQHSTNMRTLDIIDGQLSHAVPLLESSLRKVVNKDELINRMVDYDRPSLLITPNRFVIGSNAKGRALFNLSDGDRIDIDLLSSEDAKTLKHMLSDSGEAQNPQQFHTMRLTTLDHQEERNEFLVAVRRVSVSDSAHNFLMISSMDFILPDESVEAFRKTFELTLAEMKILTDLVSGLRQTDIAQKQGVREDTVKKHIRNIRDKTNASNTTALVCLAASFAQISSEQKSDRTVSRKDAVIVTNRSNQTYVMPTQHKLADVNGLRVEYVDFGDRNAKPVILLHSSMVGFILPPEFINQLVVAGYRVIIPFRPGIGVSAPLKMSFSLETTSRHLLAFADCLGLKRFSIIGGTVGFCYAAKLAALAPQRVISLIGIGGYLPVDPERLRSRMAPYQRGILYTLQHNRNLAKFLVLSGYKMYLQLGAYKFMSQLMRGSQADLRVIENANALGIISVGLRIAGAQGVDAMLNDSFLILSDWADVLKDLDRPVHLLHGSDDSVFKFEIAEEFCRSNHNFELTKVDNLGQLMIYDSPRKIASLVIQKLSDGVYQP